MIIIFWCFIILMTVLALAIVLLPLLRLSKQSTINAKKLNINLYKERIGCIKQQLLNNEISDQEYQFAEQSLQKSLLGDIEAEDMAQKVILQPAKKTALVVLFVLPIFAIVAYLYLGGSQQLQNYWVLKRQAKIVKAELAKIKNPQQVIDQLKAHLQQYPNSPKGWYLLGRLYLGERKYQKANAALATAFHLKPSDGEYGVAYAQASFFYHQQKLSPAAQKILLNVLQKTPANPAALNLLAINAFIQQRYQMAVNYWEKMIPLFSPGGRDSQVLLAMIAQAQQHLVKSQQHIKSADVVVTIKLAAKFNNKVIPNDSLFIVARAAKGGTVPLAVVRKHVRDLPMTVTLSKKQAMLPGRYIHAGERIILVARIAKLQTPLAREGDLSSKSKLIKLQRGQNRAELVINKIVR